MHKERKDKHFVKKPIYPGGLKEMRNLIRKEMRYPKEALENKIEGVVYIKYDVNYKGRVVASKVMSGIGHGCDEEAQRLVSKFKFEIPKGPRKMKVLFHKSIKIHFRLPKKTAPKKVHPPKNDPQSSIQESEITYTVTSTPKNPTKQAPNSSPKTYSYSINIK